MNSGHEFIKDFLDREWVMSYLEIGAGRGYTAQAARESCGNVTSVDASFCDEARKRLDDIGVRMIEGDSEDILPKIQCRTYDVVLVGHNCKKASFDILEARRIARVAVLFHSDKASNGIGVTRL